MRILIAALVLIGIRVGTFPVCLGDDNTLRVGVMASMSGNWASLGDMTMKGLQLGAEEINASGGVLGRKIVFEVQDTDEAESAAKVVSAYRSLRALGLQLLIGPTGSPGGLALGPIAARDREALAISPSVGVKGFHLAGKNLFNTQGVYEQASRELARWAYQQGLQKVAVFSSQHPWEMEQGSAFADELGKAGGKVTIKVEPLPDHTDLHTLALKVISSKPDAVFFANYNQIAIASREIRALGFKGRLLAATIDASRLTGPEGGLEGAVFMRLYQTAADFEKKFQVRFGVAASYPADFAFDALLALARAIEASKSLDPSAIAPALAQVSFEGASGLVSFDREGCIVRTPSIWRVVGGAFEPLRKVP